MKLESLEEYKRINNVLAVAATAKAVLSATEMKAYLQALEWLSKEAIAQKKELENAKNVEEEETDQEETSKKVKKKKVK